MTNTAIRVESLSKRYRIGGPQAQYKTIRETVMEMAIAPAYRLRRLGRPVPPEETIWALKDVSLEVKQGEVVGIIGRNGAGKTTLLKILSRITEPTEGRAEIRGRVGSLLEVGTGFHPELTGRENIYLNGAILGMKRAEIDRKFDEIVQFAEIGRFLDTPVKRYSSGMYVRLAFAVAAHLEPEILLVDEVLAVGDAAFQKKCLGKMGNVAQEGRTVLFVSHNMDAVQRLCGRTMFLKEGAIGLEGNTTQVISTYLRETRNQLTSHYRSSSSGDKGKNASLIEAEILNSSSEPSESILFGEPFAIRTVWEHRTRTSGVDYAILVYDEQGRLLFAVNTIGSNLDIERKGVHEVLCQFPDNFLVPAEYRVSVGCYRRPHTTIDVVEYCLKLMVVNVPFDPDFTFNIVTNPIVGMRSYWEELDDTIGDKKANGRVDEGERGA